jgi:hypothetical protein
MLRLRNKLKFLSSLAALSLLLVVTGCRQDSIFDYIAGETAPTSARIRGGPSKIVGPANGKLYVANGRIWEYNTANSDARWDGIAAPPGGFVVDVAVDDSDGVYALVVNNASGRVWKRNDPLPGWTPLDPPGDGYGFIQNIFGAGDTLFATGAQRLGGAYEYAILYYDSAQTHFKVLEKTGAALLSGAGKVGSDYFLATTGKGIYQGSLSGISAAATDKDGNPIFQDIAGFLQSQNIIIGISRVGHVVYIDSSGIEAGQTTLGGTYTGGLALMKNPDAQSQYDELLLLGFRGSSNYQHGYMELQFNSSDGTYDNGIYDRGWRVRVPGAVPLSSVNGYQQYDSSLRRYPVTALWVLAPDGTPPGIIFASTTNKGLYSYRERSDGGWQWNHEE